MQVRGEVREVGEDSTNILVKEGEKRKKQLQRKGKAKVVEF